MKPKKITSLQADKGLILPPQEIAKLKRQNSQLFNQMTQEELFLVIEQRIITLRKSVLSLEQELISLSEEINKAKTAGQ